MGRRSDHTRTELKEMAINAAIEMIEKEGLKNFSTRNVAREIGYTIGTIYNIFRDMDELILYVSFHALGELYKQLKTKRDLLSMAKAYIEFAYERHNLWSVLFEHRLPEGEDSPEWLEHQIKQIFDLVEKTLSKKAPDVSQKEIEKSAKIIWAGVHGICVLSLSGKIENTKAEEAKKLAKEFLENYLKGFEK